MEPVNYFKIINKYISPASRLYSIYVPHVVLVTNKALKIARRMKVSEEQMQFIEEASMLHDIGVVRVHAPGLGCEGSLPYLSHVTEGAKILETEGLPRHARLAECHTGVGLFAEDIIAHGLPLPPKDYLAETLEEKIVAWADIFFSKDPRRLWEERTLEEGRAHIAQYGERYTAIFDEWAEMFE